jgi:glycosyltransferase involved in cell wall biosynthesis
MKIYHLTHKLDLGGTAGSLQLFATEQLKLGHEVVVVSNEGGEREESLLKKLAVVRTSSIAGGPPKADVVHLHSLGGRDEMYTELLRSWKEQGARIIQTNIFGGYDKDLHQLADSILFVSKALYLKFMLQHPELKLSKIYGYLYNPVDVSTLRSTPLSTAEREAKRAKLSVSSEQLLCGRVGRPDLGKWDHTIEDVVTILAKKNLPICMAVMSAPKSVERRISKSKYAKNWRFLRPTSSTTELSHFYQLLDVNLHGSSIGETFGCSIAEGMCLGLPSVVRSTHFTINQLYLDNAQIELVEDGVTGFTRTTAIGLADAVTKLFDANLRKSMGESARSKADLFSADMLTQHLVETYYTPAEGIGSNKQSDAFAKWEKAYKDSLEKAIIDVKSQLLLNLQRYKNTFRRHLDLNNEK